MIPRERLGHGVVEGDHVHLGAAGREGVGQQVASLGGTGHQHATALHGHRLESLDQRLGHGALGHHVGAHAAPAELGRGTGPDGGHGGARERPGVGADAVERGHEQRRPVRARDADERVGADLARRTLHLGLHRSWHDPDGRRLDHLRSQRTEPCGQPACLGARPGDDHAATEQRAALDPRDGLAAGDHRADHGDGRRPQSGLRHTVGDVGENARHRPLPGQRAALDDRHRLLGRPTRGGEPRGDQPKVLDPHIEHERAREGRERGPVERRLGLLGVLVAGHQGHRGGLVAVGDRHAGVGGRRHPRRHAGHHLEGHARRGQRLGLLAAPTEHERIAALEAHHRSPGAPHLHEQRVDLLLRHRGPARGLAHVAHLGVGAHLLERTVGDQAVVEDRVGTGEKLERAPRHEAGIARPGAHEIDRARRRRHGRVSVGDEGLTPAS
ncbi:MAG: hypothetical protein WKF31_09370 [Thermoleophilaceae bacterium]